MSGQTAVQTQVAAKPAITPIAGGVLQRQCACGQHTSTGGECEECKQKREGVLQRAAINPSPVHDVPSIVHEVLRSPGQPLDAATRAFMEPRFGHDFSGVKLSNTAHGSSTPLRLGAAYDDREHQADEVAEQVMQRSPVKRTVQTADLSQVRVHTDSRAAESVRAVNALAYTVGRDVVFGAGQYAPQTRRGRQLLAHELTHVAQQSSEAPAAAPSIQRAVEVRPPGRGEASAFDRRQELIDRLNTLSAAIQYRLDGRRILYEVIDEVCSYEL